MSYLLKFREWKIIHEKSKPATLVVELSTVCNRNCTYCFRRGIFNLKQEFIECKVINRLLSDNFEKIVFTGFGEPTLHPNFEEIFLNCTTKCNRIVLNTNGTTLLDYIRIFSKFLHKLEIFLSLHDVGSIVSLLEEVKHRCRDLLQCIRLIVVLSKDKLAEIVDILNSLSNFSIPKIYLSNMIPITSDACDYSCIDDPESENVLNDIKYRILPKSFIQNTFIYVSRSKSCTSTFICPFVSNYATFIRVNGMVAPCMFYAYRLKTYIHCIERVNEPIIFGDLRENDILTIWNSDNYAKFRFYVSIGAFPNCLDCELERYCTFTTSNMHDCWGNSPTCSYCPFARGLAFCPV